MACNLNRPVALVDSSNGKTSTCVTMLNKEVIELKAELEIEAIRYDMQMKVSKTTSHLLTFLDFFVVFVAVFLGNYHGA
jgi:hypothetical protein